MLRSLVAFFAVLMMLAAVSSASPVAPINLAPLGRASASSVWQDSSEMTPDKALDGNMSTRWGGKARGEWFEIDWDVPQTICGAVLHNYNESWNKNIPFTASVWDESLNNGTGGFREVQTITPVTSQAIFLFPSVATKKLRISNVITFWEIQVFNDPKGVARMIDDLNRVDVAVAGDMQGRLVGTVSQNEGSIPIADAGIEVRGHTHLGRWKQSVKSDRNGFFTVDMPFGSTGKTEVTVKSDGQTSGVSIDAGDIAQPLTIKPVLKKNRLPLEGEWQITMDPPGDFLSRPDTVNWRKIQVPSNWEMQRFSSETGVAAYRKTFDIPEAWKSKRIKFRSDGIYSRAEVWVNGRRIGSHDGGATPFELDITEAAKTGGQNTILVRVTDHSDAGDLDAMSYYAHLNIGGIWRPLEIFCVEPVHVSGLTVTTDFDDDYRNAVMSVKVDVANESSGDIRDARLDLKLIDPNGRKVVLDGLNTTVSLGPWERKRIGMSARVIVPGQWSAELPKLYRLRGDLDVAGQGTASVEQRFGFKEVEIKGRTYTVNGKPVKLWGSCRHDAHPLMGRAITPEVAKQDVELMKAANLNAMRTSHYPPHPAAIDAADELGLYVEDEAPFCFVSVGYGPEAGRTRSLADDLRLAPLAISLTAALLERDRNHPSVVMWSVCNESAFGRIFQMTHEYIRNADPTRPCGAGQSANLEIATYHNPTSLQRMKDTADFTTPVLFDEGFAIFQGFGASRGSGARSGSS